jgi:hypothetical protein
MPNNDSITLDRSEPTDENVDYSVGVENGKGFRLGFSREILDVWSEQLSRDGRNLELDPIADGLAREILNQNPSEDELNEGFLVTMKNGFATPTAATQNLRNSGTAPFRMHRAA